MRIDTICSEALDGFLVLSFRCKIAIVTVHDEKPNRALGTFLPPTMSSGGSF